MTTTMLRDDFLYIGYVRDAGLLAGCTRCAGLIVHRFNVVMQSYWLGVYRVCWFDCTQVQRGDAELLAGCVQGVLV